MPPERRSEPSNPDMAALSEAITHHRNKKGLSLQAVADDCKLNYEHLTELARGHGNPTFQTLMELCEGLDTPIGELMMSVQRIRREHARS
jgi:transcriptional regulator with XRE-family HTH domain